jgi:hypothetical protein
MPNKQHLTIVAVGVFVVVGIYFYAPYKDQVQNAKAEDSFVDGASIKLPDDYVRVTHVKTPQPMKAIYMTSWVAGTPSLRQKVIKIIEETEVNAVVIDIKDDTGKVSFLIENEPFASLGSSENRISDIKELIADLHSKNIYVIGRISTFQDPYLIKKWPEEAVKTASDKNVLWRDRKGIGWFDAGSPKVWDYVTALAHESYNIGFDEINFDYIRFPSDGNMKDIYFSYSEGKSKSDTLESFFKHIDQEFRKSENPIPISADLFGMVTTNTDDLGIGQVLERAAPYVDFIYPMVYPSHFPDTWHGYANPAEKPYEVIKITMDSASEKLKAIGEDPDKIRPWLQDFNLGATYNADMVRAQIKATYDAGLTSWLIWDPRNIYSRGAFLSED